MKAGPDVVQTIVTKYKDIGEIVAQDRTDFAVVPTQEPPTAPDITGFDPHRGPIGTQVTIRGTNFEDVNEVRFNLRIAQFTVLSPTRILFRVPARAQTGTITVFSPDGSDTTSDVFRVRRDEHRSTIKIIDDFAPRSPTPLARDPPGHGPSAYPAVRRSSASSAS